MKDLKSFNGKRLKTARTLKGMSISELADALDLQRQTVSMYESGKISNPDFPKVQKMSQLLNFPIDFFLDSDTELVKAAPSTYFRSLLTTNKKYRYEQEIKINFVSTIYGYNRPDLTPLYRASETVGKVMKPGAIVVYESTVYPGCTEEDCVPVLEKYSSLKFNQDFYCGYSPERINPGDKEHRLTKILKITSGSTPAAAEIVAISSSGALKIAVLIRWRI